MKKLRYLFLVLVLSAIGILNTKAQETLSELHTKGYDLIEQGKCKPGLELIEQCANNGYGFSQYYLGYLYEKGICTEQNYNKAFKWYKKAVEITHRADAKTDLARCYLFGYGCQTDDKEAVTLLQESANEGYGKAYFYLGFVYENGAGVEKDLERAKQFYRKAVENKGYWSADAEYFLKELEGDFTAEELYNRGLKFIKEEDYAKALFNLQKSAEKGLAIAQNDLGVMYDKGIYVTKNTEEAIKWLKKSADQNCVQGLHNLAYAYFKGNGVEQSVSKAFQLYLKAAIQGFAESETVIATFYEDGVGTTKNMEEAIKWYKSAAKHGNAIAQQRLKDLKEDY